MPSTPLASGQSEGMSSDYTKHAPPKRITPPPCGSWSGGRDV